MKDDLISRLEEYASDWRIRAGDVGVVHDAINAIKEIEKERDEARALVTEANNSLYGSQGYFHSLNGGAFDKYHLANGIEELKALVRAWRPKPNQIPNINERGRE